MDISSGAPTGLNGSRPAGWIKDGSDQTFMQDVIEASRDKIVLVDFWAPWCGPCKQLGPALEKVVGQANGDVLLVKINIDEHQGVAGQLGVKSVPTVFAFKNGQPVNGFQGALPESQLKQFIKSLGGGSALEQIEAALDAAGQAFQDGELSVASDIYRQIIEVDPENVDALAGLARCQLANKDVAAAQSTLERVPADKRNDPAVKSVQTAIELSGDTADTGEASELAAKVNANPDDLDARFELAKAYSAKGAHQKAVDELLAILSKELEWNEGAAKAQLLKIFEAAGPTAEVTKSGRRRLSSLLFN